MTTGMDEGAHPTLLTRVGRRKSYNMPDDYLEASGLFEGHPRIRVLYPPRATAANQRKLDAT